MRFYPRSVVGVDAPRDLHGAELTAYIDAQLIADGHDPECVTWVCAVHRRHCTLITTEHAEHKCYWGKDLDPDDDERCVPA